MRFSFAEVRNILVIGLGTCAVIPRASAEDTVSFRGNLTWINAYVHLVPDIDSILNPDNTVSAIPENALVSEVRPNIKLVSSTFQIVARPKVVAQATRVKVGDKYQDATGETKSTINEAFFNWTVSNNVSFAYGRQSYQWGAAEALSPSNRMFHETSQSRNILYEVIGKDIARVNFTLGKSFSTVIMTEYEENKDEEPFRYGDEFASTGLLKSEVSTSDGTDYFGIVIGGRAAGHGWAGEYFNLQMPFFEGLSLYGDASHQRGSLVWYPVSREQVGVNGSEQITEMQQSQKDSDKVYTMADAGLRYDFEQGTILRIEYISNDAGYTKEERELYFASLLSISPTQRAVLAENGAKFGRNGLELPGQKYVYVSAHIPDFLTIRDLTFFMRALRSVNDESLNAYTSFDYLVGDAGTISVSASGDGGDKNTELRSLVKRSYTLAYTHNW